MIPKECKRLAEVDFPIAAVSAHSAREKCIRHGHPSTLHLWWARRPLAACRAVLMALLLPDPCDPHCPPEFKQCARTLLKPMPGGAAVAPVSSPANEQNGAADSAAAADITLRKALLNFIADFSNWDNSASPSYLECARGLVRAAHGPADGRGEYEPPLVVDPFAGGGSIPLEALRLGCDAFASDLNPVACLILKVMLEDIPRHGPALADELRRVGKQIKDEAEKELAEFYPPDPDGAKPIAYLWARTVRCEAVGCGAEIPLMRSFWLCKKANRRRALRLVPVAPGFSPAHAALKGGATSDINTLGSRKAAWRLEIFQPKSESEVRDGTVRRGNAACPCCNTVLPVARVRVQLAAEHGGADVKFNSSGERGGGARLLAVVTLDENKSGRQYRLPLERDYGAAWKAQKRLKRVLDEWQRLPADERGLCPVPDEPTPAGGGSGAGRAFSVQKYGMLQWGDLFTARQKLLLATLSRKTARLSNGGTNTLMGMVVDRCAAYGCSMGWWHLTGEKISPIFGRQAIPMTWDFVEAHPLADSSGNVDGAVEWVARVAEAWPGSHAPGQTELADATRQVLPVETCQVWFTDPPYYDAVPYADLSDFFFVRLRRTLPDHPLLNNPFEPGNPLTPKWPEIVQDEVKHTPDGRPKDKAFFEESMQKAFAEGRRILKDDGVGAVVFAHKTTEGWEALISGMLRGGWAVSASWPITTEMSSRLRARDSAALAASVHLVCRPREINAGIGDWTDIYRELPKRIGDWMERLSGEGIRGADLVFACIGPALELFSRYEKVETPDGELVGLGSNPEARSEPAKRGFLSYVWEVVGRTALEQVLGTAEARARNGGAGALEEDARLTALFLWTLQSTDKQVESQGSKVESEEADVEEDDKEAGSGKAKKGYTLIYDVARRFAQPLGIRLPDWEGRIIETEKGVVRLLPVTERAKQLFGEEGASAMAATIERSGAARAQFNLFPESQAGGGAVPARRRGGGRSGSGAESLSELRHKREATTLDRVHAAMLLQANGASNALRSMLEEEQKRGPDFLRLSNALSALYPKSSEEKRLLDAMLLAAPKR